MKWFFLNTGFNTGKYNMDFDLHLANTCKNGEAYFRLYRWQPYCISLGANQSLDDINFIKTGEDNIDVIKRPTGGRAILHAEEITYSVIIPLGYYTSPLEIYKEINFALLQGLTIYNPVLSSSELEQQQPDFKSIYKNNTALACFASAAKNELKFNGKKLIGSAQRKLGNIILQHGSILCGKYHRNIINYINLINEEKKIVEDELNNKTIELEAILEEEVDYQRLADSLLEGFQKHFNEKFVEAETDFKIETIKQ
jgi:lipoate-protein ligase A